MREMVIDQCLGTGREFTREALQTAVMVTENKSPRGERATAEAIANGFLTEADLQKSSEKPSYLTENDQKPSEKPSNLTENEGETQPQKQPKLKIPDFLSKIVEDVKHVGSGTVCIQDYGCARPTGYFY